MNAVNYGGMQANMGPFAPVSLKGNAAVNGVPVFIHQLPMTIGGIAGKDVHFGRVVSVNPINRRQMVEGIPSGNIVKGIAMLDPVIMRADPGMQDYYFAGRPMTATTFGLVQISEYDTTKDAPLEGSTVWCRNDDGRLAFNDGTDISASGYTKLNAFVYETLGPNGATVFFNLPLVEKQTRESTTKVGNVSATPAAGAVKAGTVVSLASATPGATIYYTIDGTSPTMDSQKYDGASGINISAAVTIKAVAVKEGYDPSPEATFAYTIQA